MIFLRCATLGGKVEFLSLMKQMVAADAQLVIATHSPLLLAFPGAQILCFDEEGVRETACANPERFLREL